MIPRTLKIGGHVYQVEQVNRGKLGTGVMADIDNEVNVIRLYRRAAPSRKVELLIHEALHAVLCGYEVDDVEAIIVTVGEAFTEFIKSNPSFIRHALKVLSQ